MSCAGLHRIRGSDRQANDPQRGVGPDQTRCGLLLTSRLGTDAMLVGVADAVQTNFGAGCHDVSRDAIRSADLPRHGDHRLHKARQAVEIALIKRSDTGM